MRKSFTLLSLGVAALAMVACSKNVGVPGQPAGSKKATKAADPASRLARSTKRMGRMGRMGKMGKMSKLPPGHPPMGGHGKATGPTLTWKLPSGWKAVKRASRMRLAQFELAAAEGAKPGSLAVFHFPGQGGSVMGNVQRWIRQFKQPAGAKAKPEVTDRSANGLKITRVRYSGTYLRSKNPGMMGGPKVEEKDYALLAAIVQTPRGPWFFKGVGPKKTMDAQLKTFDAFLASVAMKHPAGAKKPATKAAKKASPSTGAKKAGAAGAKQAASKKAASK